MTIRKFLFVLLTGIFVASLCSCGKYEPGDAQFSGQTTEQDFAKIHENVRFKEEDKEKLHGLGLTAEGTAVSPHGMGFHGKGEKADPDQVIALVNGEKIYRRDLDKILDRFRHHVNPDSIPSMEKQITDQLIVQTLLRQFVKEKNLNVPDEVVEKEIKNMRENIRNNPATKGKTLEQFLELQGSNIDELKTAINMSAAVERYVSKDIDDKRLEEYFIKNITNFNGETVTASHILIDTRGMETQEELDRARAKIESIKKELDEGADFEELAKKYSDCPTGKSGGSLGTFPRKGVMVDSFASAAFEMEVGTVSDPVKTEFGYHLIKVTEHTQPKDVSFDQVKDKVREELVAIEMNDLVKDLRAQADIKVTLH